MTLSELLKWLAGVIALIILIDYILPVETIEEEVISIHRLHQKYNNAGGNSHYAYDMVTTSHSFPISYSETEAIEKGQQLSLQFSPLFDEFNRAETATGEKISADIIRLFTGLILPLIILLIIGLARKYGESLEIVLFVAQVAALGDLVYVLI